MALRVLVRLLVGTALLGSPSLVAHQVSSHGTGNQRLPSIEEELRRHNIELTSTSLLQALGSRNAEVRWLAAEKLAVDKTIEAVPAMKAALDVETVPGTKENIAMPLLNSATMPDLLYSGSLAATALT